MRFVRIFLDPATGEPAHVFERETLLDGLYIEVSYPAVIVPADDPHGDPILIKEKLIVKFECADLGLVDDFDPIGLDGKPCSHAGHIYQRIEKHPLADTHPDAPKVHFKPEHKDVPRVHFCPCDTKGIEAHLKANGHDRLPTTVHAWLAHILPPHEVKRLGIGAKVHLAHTKALEKARRGQVDGGRLFNMEREIHQRAEIAREKRTGESRADYAKAQEQKQLGHIEADAEQAAYTGFIEPDQIIDAKLEKTETQDGEALVHQTGPE